MATYSDDFSTDTSAAWQSSYVTITYNAAQQSMTFDPQYYQQFETLSAGTPADTETQYSKVVFTGVGDTSAWCGGPSVRYVYASPYTHHFGAEYSHSGGGKVRIVEVWHDNPYYPAASGSAGVVVGQLNFTTDEIEIRLVNGLLTAYKNGVAITGLIDVAPINTHPAGPGSVGLLLSVGGFSSTFTSWEGGDYSGGASVAISSVSDSTLYSGQTGIVITGTGFGASQGSGQVIVSPTDNVDDSSAVLQTVTSWGDTSITITAVQKHLAVNVPYYLFVKTDGAVSNESGFSVMYKFLGPITPRTFARAQAATLSGTGDVTP